MRGEAPTRNRPQPRPVTSYRLNPARDTARGKLTITEYSQEWLQGKVRIRGSTRLMYDSVLRNQILPTWGNTRLDAVRHEDVAVWVTRLNDSGLSAARIRHAWVVFSQILDLAVRAHRIPNNQAKGVELPALPSKSERDKTRFLDEREVWRLAGLREMANSRSSFWPGAVFDSASSRRCDAAASTRSSGNCGSPRHSPSTAESWSKARQRPRAVSGPCPSPPGWLTTFRH